MANHIELINLSNATHNGGTTPDEWNIIDTKSFGSITTQAYQNTITKEVVLTIKGTDGDLADWTVVNASFATGNYPKEIQDLVSYAYNEFETKYDNVSVTGFSQGGGLAELLSYTFGWGGNGQNSPGAGNIVVNPQYFEHISELGIQAKGVSNDFVTIIEDGDIVDNFGSRLSDVFELNLTGDSSLLYAIGGILVPEPLAKIYAIYKVVSERIGQHDIQKVTDYVNNLSDDEKASLLISLKKTTFDDNLVIYGDPSNPDKITFTDENGDYQEWGKDKNGNYVQTNATDYSDIGKTAINQIGSLIIMNNQDFSNIEKIAVSTSVATIADFATYKTKRKIL
ncbi:MAG: hypothetical protein WC149_12545 [Arcobacteraceae bacterium]